MARIPRPGSWGVAAVVLALAFAFVANAFVRQPGLGTFADDSVSYLVMGQVFTPWREASAAVASVFRLEAFHPPLYPALLALTGAAYDFPLAHSLNALLLAACLPFVYALGTRWLRDRPSAFAATVATVLLPSLWIHVRGILSEPLFCLILLAVLWTAEAPGSRRRRVIALCVLLSALALTRTVGLVVAAGYAAWALTRREPWRDRAASAAPAAVALGAYVLWTLARPEGIADTNAGLAADRLAVLKGAASPLAAFGAGLLRQAGAMADAWAGALLLFWVEGQVLRPLLAGLLGVLALAGLALRFWRGCADAWMCAAYLGVYLLWPFYDQMTRFLFPVVPLLLLYAFCFAAALADRVRRRPAAAGVLLTLLVASLALPGLAFMHQRFNMAGPQAAIIDWYRTPDLAAARERTRVHLDLAADMDAIRMLTSPQDRIMWVAPAYVALLADRRAVPAPSARLPVDAYRAAVRQAAPDYVFLTAYHPRDTIRDDAWRAGVAAMTGQGKVIHARSVAGRPVALLVQRAP